MIIKKEDVLKCFRQMPGVGKTIALDLWEMGFRSTEEFRQFTPEALYDLHNRCKGAVQDRCMLYVFRCIVYYVSTDEEDREVSKQEWWNWKD